MSSQTASGDHFSCMDTILIHLHRCWCKHLTNATGSIPRTVHFFNLLHWTSVLTHFKVWDLFFLITIGCFKCLEKCLMPLSVGIFSQGWGLSEIKNSYCYIKECEVMPNWIKHPRKSLSPWQLNILHGLSFIDAFHVMLLKYQKNMGMIMSVNYQWDCLFGYFGDTFWVLSSL